MTRFCPPLETDRPSGATGWDCRFGNAANVRPRLTVSFSALWTTSESEPFYQIDFALPPEVETLFSQQRWGRTFRC